MTLFVLGVRRRSTAPSPAPAPAAAALTPPTSSDDHDPKDPPCARP